MSGETQIYLTGSLFANTNEAVVYFGSSTGGLYVNATVLNSSVISVVSPAFPVSDDVTMSLALNGQQFLNTTLPFRYYSALFIFLNETCLFVPYCSGTCCGHCTAASERPCYGPNGCRHRRCQFHRYQ